MRNLTLRLLICFSFLAVSAASARAQAVPFDSPRWEFHAKEGKVVEHLGRPSLALQAGIALVRDSEFTDGVIEFDVACTSERAFLGAIWRVQDDENFEDFYIRTHQSGNPDANQYQPVFHGVTAWQLYSGEGYGAPVKYDFNQWMPIKIVVSGPNAEVYIKDMQEPALFVNELKRPIQSGKVGLRVINPVPAYFSNFRFTPMDRPPLKGKPKVTPTPPGTVMRWQVSSPIDGKSLENEYRLTNDVTQSLTWQTLESESTGITNLARLHGVSEGRDTVFARLTIVSDRAQVKKIRFGFSDAVKVYFNGQLLYGGHDAYQSRDYRFLGTMGLFDDLYLPLRPGENELWLAVSETFGGWGVIARFDDLSGITLQP